MLLERKYQPVKHNYLQNKHQDDHRDAVEADVTDHWNSKVALIYGKIVEEEDVRKRGKVVSQDWTLLLLGGNFNEKDRNEHEELQNYAITVRARL